MREYVRVEVGQVVHGQLVERLGVVAFVAFARQLAMKLKISFKYLYSELGCCMFFFINPLF
jgi:hypothetical protein